MSVEGIRHIASPDIIKYIESKSPNFIPLQTDNNISSLSHEELTHIRNLENEKAPPLVRRNFLFFKKQVPWKKVSISKREADNFQNQVIALDKNGHFIPGKWGSIFFPTKARGFEPKNDIQLTANHNTIFGGERWAITLYATACYLLLNGIMNNDQTSIDMWILQKFGKTENELTPSEKAILEEAKVSIREIAAVLASGINKLPPFQGALYRGDAMPLEELASWKNGKIMITSKFFSCTTNAAVAEDFAKKGALDYMAFLQVEHKPVLYIFNSQSSKDISAFVPVGVSDEEEKLYLPGQVFKANAVDEESIPGLAIIYLDEVS